MDMVGLTVHFNKLGFKICTNFLKVSSKASKGIVVKDGTAIFGDEDQMDMHLKNAMSAVSYFA